MLGLRTLTVIDKALRMVRENHGVDLKAEDIPLDDEKAFELLRSGRTVGVFQLESEGMRELLRNLQPTVFSDVVAVNALYRPGPLGSNMHVEFVERKHGRKKIQYEHPLLEPILRDTYGVILYQEQVMKIASDMGGFSLGEADILRKAMGKKILEVMAEQKKKFIEGAVARDIKKATAEKVFGQMEEFAKYGFNKSHSAAYAVVSMRTAYLKANYPAEFIAATLSSEIDDTDRITVLLEDCREFSIPVVAPNLNVSEPDFRARDARIYYGLGAVKNVGMLAVEHIVEERNQGGPYRSLESLCSRVNSRVVNKRVYESLIQSGALDSLPGHRAQLMAGLEQCMDRAARKHRDAARGQFGLFGGDGDDGESDEAPLPEVPEWSAQEQLRAEKEALGFFLTGHPLDRFKDVIAMMCNSTSKKVKDSPNGDRVVIGGLVTSVKFILDRNQRQMAFVTLEDREGQSEVVVFADVLEKSRGFIVDDAVVLVEGKVSKRNGGEGKVLVNTVLAVDSEQFPACREVHFTLDLDTTGEEKVAELKQMLASHEGESKIFFHVKEGSKRACVIRSRSHGVKLDYDLVSTLSESIGADNIRVVPTAMGA